MPSLHTNSNPNPNLALQVSTRMKHASSESDLETSVMEQHEVDLTSPNDYLFVHKRRLESIGGAIQAQGTVTLTLTLTLMESIGGAIQAQGAVFGF